MKGQVVSGFGRGSKELGIPTANIPVTSVPWIDTAKSGVYFGWAGIHLPLDHPDIKSADEELLGQTVVRKSAHEKGWRQYPMVMSIGYNPFYKNTVRSAEVHVLHKFEKDFYESEMAISILGYIRPELDYVDVESLIKDINTDIEVAKTSLGRGKWRESLNDSYLWGEGA
jgi:riboflavin kinase